MATVREMFDEMSLNVTAFLQGHAGVSKLYFHDMSPVAAGAFAAWERSNSPCILPDDLKAFLQISDGLLLKWDAKLHGETNLLGTMHLNPLNAITEIPLDKEDDTAWIELLMGQGELLPPTATMAACSPQLLEQWRELRAGFRAFDLDSSCVSGHVALLYTDPKNPQVWFQDLARQWHLIARSFTDYFRLLIMHLGLPNWHYAFTDVGLDITTKQWFRFLSPERLAIDMEHFTSMHHKRRYFRGEAPSLAPATPSAPAEPAGEDGAEAGDASGVRLDLENLEKLRGAGSKGAAAKKSKRAPAGSGAGPGAGGGGGGQAGRVDGQLGAEATAGASGEGRGGGRRVVEREGRAADVSDAAR